MPRNSDEVLTKSDAARHQGRVSWPCRRTTAPDRMRRGADETAQLGEGPRLRRGAGNLEALVAHLPHRRVQAVAGRGCLLPAQGPRRIVEAAARRRAGRRHPLRVGPAASPGRAGHALEQKNPLVREPEMRGERRVAAIRLTGEPTKDEAQLADRALKRGGASGAGKGLDLVPNAPGAQKRGGQQGQPRRQRHLRDLLDVAPLRLLRLDLVEQNPFPGNLQRLGAPQDFEPRLVGVSRRIGGRWALRRRRPGGRNGPRPSRNWRPLRVRLHDGKSVPPAVVWFNDQLCLVSYDHA